MPPFEARQGRRVVRRFASGYTVDVQAKGHPTPSGDLIDENALALAFQLQGAGNPTAYRHIKLDLLPVSAENQVRSRDGAVSAAFLSGPNRPDLASFAATKPYKRCASWDVIEELWKPLTATDARFWMAKEI